MKKGFINAQTAFILSVTLAIIFFILAYTMLFTDTGAKTVDALNYYVGSKVGIVINPAKLEKLSPTGTLLNAKITAQPESPVCANEPVYFSANSTSLPSDVNLTDANCYWDFDTASEPCSFYTNADEVPQGLNCAPGSPANNSDTTDDYQATTCDAVSNGPWPSSDIAVGDKKQGVQLVMVAGGKTDTDTLLVKSTLMCACAGVSPGCSDEPATDPVLPASLANQKTINVSFKESWSSAAIHIIIEPVGKVSDLKVGIESHVGYQMTGNLTNPAIVYGQNLLHLIEQQRSNCAQSGTDPCIVPLSFYFSGTGSIKIREIWIPLGIALA
ncbi:MAG: hypothetical protein NTY99_00075 [DPANN group archaeon]|nr:hypothetical protein [DPANN group archaeon]